MEKYPDKRTNSKWANNCLDILQKINPDYYPNKNVKGKFIEFQRKDSSGIYISQNFINIRGCYHLGFALTFTSFSTVPLYHPLMIGSRFDKNFSIWRQFFNDLNLERGNAAYPKGVWSFGAWYKNTMDLLEEGLKIPEDYLLDYYRNILSKGKHNLLRLFQRVNELFSEENLKTSPTIEEYSVLAQISADEIQKTRPMAINLDAGKIAKGGMTYYGWGDPKSNLFNLDEVPTESIIFHNWDIFQLEKERIKDIILIIEKL